MYAFAPYVQPNTIIYYAQAYIYEDTENLVGKSADHAHLKTLVQPLEPV